MVRFYRPAIESKSQFFENVKICENSHSEMAERTDGASSQLRCAPNEHVNSVSFDYIRSLILSEFDRFGSVRSMACVFVFFSFRFGSVRIVPIDSSRAHN